VGLDPSRICLQFGEFLRVHPAAGGNDGEGQQDVGSRERSTAKILAIVWRRGELGLQEAKVRGVVFGQVRLVYLVRNASRDRFNEERDRGVADV
jgi:hypothetical protein